MQQGMVVFSGSLRKGSTKLVAGFKGRLRPKVVLGPFYHSHTPSNSSFHLGPGQNCQLLELIQNKTRFNT